MNASYKLFIMSIVFVVGLKSNNDLSIEASFCGDATILTNILPSNSQKISALQGTLKDSLVLTACQAMQLGTLSRGYNAIGCKRSSDTLIVYDPLYQQVKEALHVSLTTPCDTLERGYNILGRTLADDGSLLYDVLFAPCAYDQDSLFANAEYKAAHFSLALLFPNKSLFSCCAIAYDSPNVNRLIEVCRSGDSVALKALLDQDKDLCAVLCNNIENATTALNKAGSLRLNCLEAAMLGTLERGYNVIGLLFDTNKGIIIDALFHDIMRTLDVHGVALGALKIHLEQ